MADGLCTEDTVGGGISKKSTVVIKDYVVNKCGVNDDNLVDDACENVKSFFLNSDSNKLCSKVCGVLQKGSKHEEGYLEDMPCSSLEEDCRKKRCADRYDSSESSDSGVATLSCTDCSTYSGGSTTSSASDITDPGSPFSTASSHSEDSSAASNTQSNQKMAPNLMTTHHSVWPWTGNGNSNTVNCISTMDNGSSSPPLKRSKSIEEKTNHLNNNHPHLHSSKKLKTECNTNSPVVETNINNVKVTKTLPTVKDSNSNKNEVPAPPANSNTLSCVVPTTNSINTSATKRQTTKRLETSVSFMLGNKVQQGKITEYFKSQMKPNTSSIKRDTVSSKDNIDIDSTAQSVPKYFALVDGPKLIFESRSSKLPPNWSKLDVRGLTISAAPVKKVLLDTKTKKISPLTNNAPRSIVPASRNKATNNNNVTSLKNTQLPTSKILVNNQPAMKLSQPMVKLLSLRYQQHQIRDGSYTSPKPAKPPDGSDRKESDKLQNLPVTNLNLTLSSTIVPIPFVKFNSLSSKVNTKELSNAVKNKNANLSVETAIPTVPTAKPKSSNLLVTTTSQKPSQSKKNPSVDINISTNSETASPVMSVADSDEGFSSLNILITSSTSSEMTSEPQKSPILSQPKTIRFPAKLSLEQRRQDSSDSGLCRWQECHSQFDTSGALLEHLQIKHVISQATQEHYVCLWIGCKVHGRASCSRSWLERHVLSHAGNKPFRCIVNGCGYRFSSQQALEKHVNSHFNSNESSSSGNTRKSCDSSTTKLFKRNGKKLRYRRQPWSARMVDYFDAGIMEKLQYRLINMTERMTAGNICSNSTGVTFQSRVIARRIEPNGQKKLLLRWYPPDIVPDEWVLESEVSNTKTVPLNSVESSSVDTLCSFLFPPVNPTGNDVTSDQQSTQQRKNRRKNVARSS